MYIIKKVYIWNNAIVVIVLRVLYVGCGMNREQKKNFTSNKYDGK